MKYCVSVHEVAISGGKDSDVLIQLCKMGDVWG